ncbi:hypothetical protein CVS30_14800 [Arthrobacter psychrolactophilus]|uniref:Uncharacterized protein n=1 Tax=Arthrobacter psychrolactophilus TaxID=92442 RepID=A0A2V5J531_9MICC|nr:hypothetical protein CVS30_14800 [Arthrobacter psychrolactophilus]
MLTLSVGVFWLLHASLRVHSRKEAKYTAWLLLAGLPVMAIAFSWREWLLRILTIPDPHQDEWAAGW